MIPSHGITTLYYLVRKHATKSEAESALDRILSHFSIGNLDSAEWRRARDLAMPDFEDAVVAVTAESTGSAYVVTRNLDDFANSPIPAISPEDLLVLMASMPWAVGQCPFVKAAEPRRLAVLKSQRNGATERRTGVSALLNARAGSGALFSR